MKQPKPVTIDYETLGIMSRPVYPPIPVGVSIKYPGKKAHYYSWGHPTNNNCDYGTAKTALDAAWKHKDGILCQNAKFDYDVATTHMDMPELPWTQVHDTMYLLFLNNPHQHNMSLKPSAELLLGMAPEEQDAVCDWLLENQPIPNVKISKSNKSEHYFGRYIAFAPGDIVGRYADGDVDRTEKLFNLLWPLVADANMLGAYDRERALMPIVLGMERFGVPINDKRLADDVAMYSQWMGEVEAWIFKKLKCEFNLDAGQDLFEAMLQAGYIDTGAALKTPTGKYQTNKDALLVAVTDRVLVAMLAYRSQLKTCLNTFMKSWLNVAREHGRIYTTWNQIKSTDSGSAAGTRTGRFSSSPNFQNIPKEFKPLWDHEKPKSKLPKCPLKGLPPLPLVRGYVEAPEGLVLAGRDFSAQELRILAHFEGGDMAQGYVDNPYADLHQFAAELITSTTGTVITRSDAKTIAFSILYGSGLGLLAQGIGCSVDQASALKKAYLNTFPGIKEIQNDLKLRSKSNEPLTTFGGRKYFCEAPKIIDGRLRHFDYKMTNYLIQGSAADQTKDAVLRYHAMPGHAPLLLMVHDELVMLAPTDTAREKMMILKDAMDNAGLDVPMISEGETGKTWSTMEVFHDADPKDCPY
jgi:DNA polymerase-1